MFCPGVSVTASCPPDNSFNTSVDASFASFASCLQPAVLSYMLSTELKAFDGQVDSQEVGLPVSSNGLVLPCGASGRWSRPL